MSHGGMAELWYLQIDILFILARVSEAKYTRKIGTQWELIFIFSFHLVVLLIFQKKSELLHCVF